MTGPSQGGSPELLDERSGKRYTLVEVLDTEDLSSGRVHTRYRVEGRPDLLVHEACNLDQAGQYRILESVDDVEPGAFCERDYPERARVAD